MEDNVFDQHMLQAEQAIQAQNYPLAIQELSATLAFEPNNAVLWGSRAEVRKMLKDYKGAITDLTRAIELESGNATWRYERAFLLYVENELPAALRDYSKALDLCDQSDPFRLETGSDSPEQAATLTTTLMTDLIFGKALTLYRLGQHQAALEDFTLVVTKDPQRVQKLPEGLTFDPHSQRVLLKKSWVTRAQLWLRTFLKANK